MADILIIDTNVIVSALISDMGSSNSLLKMVGQGRFEIALSVALVAEYEHAVKNLDPSLRPSDASTDAIIDYLCAAAIRVAHIYFLWRPYLRDPKDDHVLELAVAASADAVVTYNKRDFKGIERFGIAVFNPYEYLVRLERTI